MTSPLDPELVTEAESVEESFRMARDALRALRVSRTKLLRKLSAHRLLALGLPATDVRHARRAE